MANLRLRSAKLTPNLHPVLGTWVPQISPNQGISGCSGKKDTLIKVLEL